MQPWRYIEKKKIQVAISLESKLNTLIPFISTLFFHKARVMYVYSRKGQKIEAGILAKLQWLQWENFRSSAIIIYDVNEKALSKDLHGAFERCQ